MLIKSLLFLFVLASINGALRDEKVPLFYFANEEELREAWEAYKLKYNKVYGPVEDAKRIDLFEKICRKITEHNELYLAGKDTWVMGLNQFSDLTVQEFTDSLGLIYHNHKHTSSVEEEGHDKHKSGSKGLRNFDATMEHYKYASRSKGLRNLDDTSEEV